MGRVSTGTLLEFIRSIQKSVANDPDIRTLLPVISDRLVTLLGYSSIWIVRIDESGRPAEFASAGGDGTHQSRTVDTPASFLSCVEKACTHTGVLVLDDDPFLHDCQLARDCPDSAVLLRSLMHEGTLYGVLAVALQHRETVTDDDISLFDSIAGDISHILCIVQAEERNRLHLMILNEIQDLVALTDLNGTILYVNKAEEKHLHRDADDLRGRNVRTFGEVPDEGATQQEIVEWTRTDGSWRGEVVNVASDGSKVYMECHTSLVRDTSGTPRYLLGVSRDIEERKKSEKALCESERRYRQYINNAPHGIFVLDSEGCFLEVNAAMGRLTGYSETELLTMTFSDVSVESDDATHDHLILRKGGESSIVRRHERKDGSTGWWSVDTVKIMDDRFLGFTRDMTEQMRLETALRESERSLKRAQRVAHIGSWQIDMNTGIVTASEESHHIYGLPPGGLTLEKIQLIPLPEERAHLENALNALILSGVPYDVTFRIKRSNDGEIAVIHSLADYDPERNIVYGTIQDVTLQKRLEEERDRYQAELRQASKMEAVGRLAGGVAHDFNNMLNVIIGNAEIGLSSIDESNPLYQDFQEILNAATRSADLTRQLLAFSRKQIIEPRVLNINELISGQISIIKRLIGEAIDVQFVPDQIAGMILIDPSQFDQVLTNLAANARDAIHGTGTITIRTERRVLDIQQVLRTQANAPGEYVVLSFEDSGEGMDNETVERIFEPFFTTKTTGRGTGLGLATVYGIVKQNDGFVDVRSAPGEGTTFIIYLPMHHEADSPDSSPDTFESPRGNETILVVEDEEQILHLAERALSRFGYNVLTASTPDDAMKIASGYSGGIHALLTDVVMPSMNGRDLQDAVRSAIPDIKTLFMSGYTADVIARHGVLDDDVAFIQKPFTVHTLMGKIREVLDS